MGKGHRHLKKLKSEKAKVKLKGSKHLPKGTNITDTNFKIKQIVIREQLKTSNSSEPLSKRKLNIKELLNRLQHYNTKAKTDAIKDFKEIVSTYSEEIVLPNLNQLIHGISHLVLDKEKSVRQESLRLINLILSQVPVEQIAPFFDILSSYFRCAMTHIDIAIQEDSLLFLDILLTNAPHLVSLHSNKIFDNFCDLISKLKSGSKPGRTLTLNLDSKLTTVKWRIKVLNRLYAILNAVIQDKQKTLKNNNQNDLNSIKHEINQLYYPVYQNNLDLCSINLNDVCKSKLQEENNIIKNIDNLVPLLFETWIEVGPDESETDVTLTEESVSVLNSILHILNLLHTFLQLNATETGNHQLVKNFKSKYKKDISKYIISHFPYTKIKSKKRKRNEDSDKRITFCTSENLIICNLFCIFNDKIDSDKKLGDKIINYIKNVFQRYNSENSEENKEFLLLLQNILLHKSKAYNSYQNELLNILNLTLELYANNKQNEDFQNGLFNILCDLVNNKQFIISPNFQIWLNKLPDLLCKEKISEKTINMIILLAKRNISFTTQLNNKFNNILSNLPNIEILDTEDEMASKYKIISLAHYISAENLLENIQGFNLDTKLIEYLREILILKG